MKPDTLYRLVLASALGFLAALVVAQAAVLVRQRRTFENDVLLERNLLEQSQSLNRVLFAMSKLFASQAPTGPASLRKRIELARSLVSHSGFYRQLDPATILHVLGDDPLGLAGRLPALEQLYFERRALLGSVFGRLAAEREMAAQEALLTEFQALSLEFLDTLMNLSRAWQQMDSMSFAHLQSSHQKEVIFLRAHQTAQVAAAALIALLGLLGARRLLRSVKSLSGLIPICANCKRIRTDQGYWSQVEHYLKQHSEAKFTHGLCPDCFRTLYGELAEAEAEKPDQSDPR